jgi:hypothetical protein
MFSILSYVTGRLKLSTGHNRRQRLFGELFGEFKVVAGESLQRRKFRWRKIFPFVVFEVEHENPTACSVCGYQSTDASIFASSGRGAWLYLNIAAQISVNKPTFHFPDRFAQHGTIQLRFSHPAR